MKPASAAERAAFKVKAELGARTVEAKTRAFREPRESDLPQRLQALKRQGVTNLTAIARAAGCGRSTAWRHLSGKS